MLEVTQDRVVELLRWTQNESSDGTWSVFKGFIFIIHDDKV